MQIFVKHQIYKTMKTFRNNFTTAEQSKRLLELGVPEWTADLRYRICKANDSVLGNPYLTKGKKYIGSHFNSSLPCWSVGRLIEIYCLCVDERYSIEFIGQIHTRPMNKILDLFEYVKLDFSKLEEGQ